MESQDKIHLLKNFVLFKQLDNEVVLQIANKMQKEEFPANVNIINENNIGDKIYFIVNGTARAYTINDKGQEIHIQTLNSGDYFGEIALFVHGKRVCSVKAITECELLSLDKDNFDHFVKKYLSISNALNDIMSLRLAEAWRIVQGKKPNTLILIKYSDATLKNLKHFEHYFEKICHKTFYPFDPLQAEKELPHLQESNKDTYILVKSNNYFSEALLKQADYVVNFVDSNPDHICLLADASSWQIEHTVRVILKKTIGIALSSGGIPAIAHLSILNLLKEKNIPLDYIVGSSAGALYGGCFAFGIPTEEILNKTIAVYKKINLLSILKNLSFNFSGIMRHQHLKKIIESMFNQHNIENAAIPFAAVASDLYTGHSVAIKSGNAADAILASNCAPIIFEPIVTDKYFLVDGAATMPLPTQVLIDEKIDIKIAVYIPQLDLNVSITSYSKMFAIYARSHSVMARIISKSNRALADVTIYPDVSDIRVLDTKSIDKAFRAGEVASEQIIRYIEYLFNNK